MEGSSANVIASAASVTDSPTRSEALAAAALWQTTAGTMDRVPLAKTFLDLATSGRLKHLTELDLRLKYIGDEGALLVAQGLRHVPRLSILILHMNDLGVDGARAIAVGLRHVPHLTTLHLWSNHMMGADGTCAIARGLRYVPQLAWLHVGQCSIGDSGACAVAAALRYVPRLETLVMEDDRIGDEGARALAGALHHVPRLKLLRIGSNKFGADGASALAAALLLRDVRAPLGVPSDGAGAALTALSTLDRWQDVHKAIHPLVSRYPKREHGVIHAAVLGWLCALLTRERAAAVHAKLRCFGASVAQRAAVEEFTAYMDADTDDAARGIVDAIVPLPPLATAQESTVTRALPVVHQAAPSADNSRSPLSLATLFHDDEWHELTGSALPSH